MKSIIAALLLCLVSHEVAAQQIIRGQGPAPATLDAAARERVIETLAAAIEREYVIPARGREIASDLRKRAGQGEFSAFSDAPSLAVALNDVLTEAGRDKHLNVRFGPPPGGMGAPPPGGPGGPGGGPGGPGSGPGGPGGPGGGPPPPEMLEQLRARNYDFTKVEILPGNVGYMQIGGLHPPQVAGETAAAALRFLGNTDAMIIDLRSSPGGTQTMVNLLASAFLPDDGRTLITSEYRGQQPNVSKVMSELPVTRRPEVPLYFLTSGRTFSAGEALPYILQQHGRAIVVGETTAGAGNHNIFVNVGEGLTASISVGLTHHPVSGTNWEGTGVVPQVSVPASDALRRAHMEALRALAASSKDPRRKAALESEAQALEWSGAGAASLQRFAGVYGERRFAVEGGVLQMTRGSQPPQSLQQIGEATFRLRDLARYEFETDGEGTIIAVTTTGPNGVPERVSRSGGGAER
jgi:retinol-binding protein 3